MLHKWLPNGATCEDGDDFERAISMPVPLSDSTQVKTHWVVSWTREARSTKPSGSAVDGWLAVGSVHRVVRSVWMGQFSALLPAGLLANWCCSSRV